MEGVVHYSMSCNCREIALAHRLSIHPNVQLFQVQCGSVCWVGELSHLVWTPLPCISVLVIGRCPLTQTPSTNSFSVVLKGKCSLEVKSLANPTFLLLAHVETEIQKFGPLHLDLLRADFSHPLIHVYCCVFINICLFRCICHWVLPHPHVYEQKPFLQRRNSCHHKWSFLCSN